MTSPSPFCGKCGKPLAEGDDRFCRACGAEIGASSPTDTTTAAAGTNKPLTDDQLKADHNARLEAYYGTRGKKVPTDFEITQKTLGGLILGIIIVGAIILVMLPGGGGSDTSSPSTQPAKTDKGTLVCKDGHVVHIVNGKSTDFGSLTTCSPGETLNLNDY